MTTPFTLYAATVTGVQNNNHYPNQNVVVDAASLTAAAGFDHVAATYVNDRRSTAAFISSNCVVMDIDNDHTETQAEWITPEKLGELMSGGGVHDRHLPQPHEAEGGALGAATFPRLLPNPQRARC